MLRPNTVFKSALCLHLSWLIILAVPVAHAQETTFEISLGGGLSPTLGPDGFKDFYDLGLNSVAGIGLHFIPHVVIGGNLSLSIFSLNKDEFSSTGSNVVVTGGDRLLIELLGMGKLYLLPTDSPTNLYAQGGAGLAISRIGDLTIISNGFPSVFEGETQNDLMLMGGLGMMFNLGSAVNLFLEGNLNIIFAENNNITYAPLRAGIIVFP